MNTDILIVIGVIVAMLLLWAWARTHRAVWGLILGLWAFFVIALVLKIPFNWFLAGAGIMILGIILWIAWLGKKLAIGALVLTLVPLLALGVSAFALTTGSPANATNVNTDGTGSSSNVAFDPEVDAIPAEAKCDTNVFVDHSSNRVVVVGDPTRIQFPTAVSIPFTGTDDAAVISELTKVEICGNPTELKMVVDEMLLWTSADIPGADENKDWLNRINAEIANAPTGLNSFVEKTPAGTFVVTETYQKYAAWVNTVLLRSVPEGQQSLTSIRNWEVSAAFDPSKGLPTATQAVEESKLAWVRVFDDKMGTCLLRFGFNAEDRRLEIFECAVPAPPAESNPSNPPTTPPPGGCKTDCSPTTPAPTPTPSCPPWWPHGTPPNCKDDGVRDPEVQGNNKEGGGGQAPVVTDPVGPPAAGTPSPIYTPPVVVQTPAPVVTPSTRPSSEPVPVVTPSAQPPSNGEIIVTPTPGAACNPEFQSC